MVKLHIGCGKRDFGKDWIHIDGGDFPHVQHHNVLLPSFVDDSVDLIYSSHLIAYFDREEVKRLLQEWYRVLKPGGILRVATPDFQTMAFLLQYGGIKYPLECFLGPLYGKMKLNESTIYHKTTYNFSSLSKLLIEMGFKDPNRYDWRKTEHSHIDDHSSAHIPHDPEAIKSRKFDNHTLISLNVECKK